MNARIFATLRSNAGLLACVLGAAGCAGVVHSAGGVAAAPTVEAEKTAMGAPPCRITAPARVAARHVYVTAGVEARANAEGFSLRFAHHRASCLTLETRSSLDAFVRVETTTACGDGNDRPLTLGRGEANHDGKTVGAVRSLFGIAMSRHDDAVDDDGDFPRTSTAGDAGGARSPNLVPVGDGRSLVLWTEGNVESMKVRARPLDNDGNAAGAAFDVSPEAIGAIGRPSGAVAANGEGVIAFFGGNGDSIDLFETPIACVAQ